MWIKNINKISRFLLNIFFPINCLGCGKQGFFICPECWAAIPLLAQSVCPACRKPSPTGKTCPNCQSSLSGIIIATDYRYPLIQKAIKSLKYSPFISSLASDLARLLVKVIKQSPERITYFNQNNFVLMPTPLAKRKLAERGFNQAELIAREITDKFGWPLKTKILQRVKETKSQTGLGKKERKLNVNNAFKIKDKGLVKNKNIILLDDIFTTGATLEEAAKTLQQAGAKEIWALVLAKG